MRTIREMPSTHVSLHVHIVFRRKTATRSSTAHGSDGSTDTSAEQIESVREYIRGQKEHHRTRTFQEEYLEFLKDCGIEYDERYVW